MAKKIKSIVTKHPVASLPAGTENVDYYLATTRSNGPERATKEEDFDGEKDVHVYEVAWNVPTSDKAAQDRYGMDLAGIILKGVQELSHGPKYDDLAKNDDGTLADPTGPQTLADAHKPGEKKVSKTKTMKSTFAKAAELGYSEEEFAALVAKMKPKKA